MTKDKSFLIRRRRKLRGGFLALLCLMLPVSVQAGPEITARCKADGIRIRWEAVEDAEYYVVYRDGEEIKRTAKTVWKDPEAEAGILCSYQVAAVVGGEMSAFSEEVDGCFLKQPVIERIYGTGEETVLTWSAEPDAEEYLVEISSRADFHGHELIRTSETALSMIPEEEVNYVRVRSCRKAEEKDFYSAWSTGCEIISYDPSWAFASYSEIHEGIAALYRSASADRKNRTVCVNPGHGTWDGASFYTLSHPDGTGKVTGGTNGAGAVYSMAISGGTEMLDGTPEAAVNLSEAEILKQKLLEAGYDVLMVRENENARLDNVARTVMANNLADCHIAIHYDSTDSDKGAFAIIPSSDASYRSMYPVSEYGPAHDALGRSLARGLAENGIKLFGEGLMEMDLTQISYSTVPSVDIEIGDRGSAYDRETQEKIADGITAGIEAYFTSER